MARLIWTEPALNDLEAIADYIGLDKPEAARRYVQRVFHSVERLLQFPKSGRVPRELPRLSYREIVISPCRIFYRLEVEDIIIVYVMRSERELREEYFANRN